MKPLIYDLSAAAYMPTVVRSVTHDSVELAALVTLRLTSVVLGFARAELSEILCSSGDNILEQLKGDSTKWFT